MSNPATDPAIEASGLVRSFGATRALDGIDLRVPAGAVYGLLGPNGAGKTTAVRVLATLLRPDGGEARVFGHDVVREADAVRGKVSLTGQFASVDEDLTGMENLVLLARLLGHRKPAARDRAAQLLAAFGLTEAADRQVKKYSGGMRRRLDVAASILNTPELLFLDEPTTGLDPRSRSQVWEIIRAVVAHGTTVLLTTQYLDEADRTLPVWRPAALVGMILGDVLRYVLAASVILGVGLVLGFRPGGGAAGVLAGSACWWSSRSRSPGSGPCSA
jgi:daunorubicin/doxorubicin transport system ATP-binding protein